MPVARTPADIMFLAVYKLAGGKILRGFMVSTIAEWLGIPRQGLRRWQPRPLKPAW
jgi:hypothetical protein